MKRLFIAVLMILSITTALAQTITTAEYFFDTDPGPGNGTPTSIGTPGISVSFPVHIPINLSPGFHWLGIRVKDSDGKWSLFQRRNFYVSQPGTDLPIITKAEYFFDTDPGVDSGTPLNFQNTGFSVSQTFPITVPVSMTGGKHYLAIRVKDQAGHWSLFQRDTIVVGGSSASITCPGNVVVTAASGQCSSIVNNIDPTVSPQGTSYTYSLTGATTGNGAGTASGKSFNVGVTTVTYALTGAPATSCSFNVTVNSGTTASVTINTTRTSICSGQQVTFTATPVNGGNTPSYQWKLNGNNIAGAIYSPYQSSSLANGDVVSVVMTSSISCASPSSATSNLITMTVHPILTPSVSITASATTICSGQSVTFTATPTNGGIQPIYQWVKNGSYADVGAVYQTSALANGDSVYVILYNTTDCIIDDLITSNVIHITTSQMVTPSVTISANPGNTICSGTNATFTATPTNGGATPSYQWKVNGNNAGTNSNTYQNSSLTDGDKITVTMIPSQSCGNNNPVVSNTITMTVGIEVVPSITMSTSATNICAGTLVTFHSSPVSGAGSSPSFQWKRNGSNIAGATNSTYQTSSLADGDIIRVEMTSSLSCANPKTILSHDSVTMAVSSVLLTPSVTILSSDLVICQGQTVTFTAIPTNGGSTPDYQWKVNGNDAGGNYEIYSCDSLHNGDIITVEMFTSVACATTPSITSEPVTMYVTQIKIYYADMDGDGYGNGASGVAEACVAPAGYVISNGDCDDNNASIHPGTTEICGNSLDDDCDGQTDEACGSPDNDSDGYTIAQGDCNDNSAAIHPGATEVCNNSIDDDCDGQVDEGCNTSTPLPVLILRTYPVKEDDAGQTILNVEVNLDMPAPLPVSVHYSTINDDAIAGADYVATNGVLVIPAGSISGSLQVRIIGDLLWESNERFRINFTDPVNAVLNEDPNSRIMIIDNDKGKNNNNNAAARTDQASVKEEIFKIPTVTRRNQVWLIPQIGNYENEVLIVNVQGQMVNKFVNYKNQAPIANVSTGLYFYRIRIMESPGQYKYYSGRLLITE